MGYGHYVLADGTEGGYNVEAPCDYQGCMTVIDRGVTNLCGDTPGGGEYGCGRWFCEEHLLDGPAPINGTACPTCLPKLGQYTCTKCQGHGEIITEESNRDCDGCDLTGWASRQDPNAA